MKKGVERRAMDNHRQNNKFGVPKLQNNNRFLFRNRQFYGKNVASAGAQKMIDFSELFFSSLTRFFGFSGTHFGCVLAPLALPRRLR